MTEREHEICITAAYFELCTFFSQGFVLHSYRYHSRIGPPRRFVKEEGRKIKRKGENYI